MALQMCVCVCVHALACVHKKMLYRIWFKWYSLSTYYLETRYQILDTAPALNELTNETKRQHKVESGGPEESTYHMQWGLEGRDSKAEG